jgi:tRNA A-37 threonylcarbamoyl transferase component Bud32
VDSSRLRAILERCYRALEEGSEPDLTHLCAGDAELQSRVASLLARERGVLDACKEIAPRRSVMPPASRIGEFTVLELLGVGGMSHVYRARQEPLDREVALKVLRDDLVATEIGRLRFQREASITAALDHPNIVPVYAAGQDGENVYLAMKLLRGQPLDRLPLPLPVDQVAAIGVQVANALQAAHEIGVVHRDVKPANVMLEHDVAYVLDFGLSSFMHSVGALTRPDSTPGTLIYLAPELVRRRHGGLDPRVDVYGLGATLYELLAGRPPFEGGNPVQVLHRILHHDPAPLALPRRGRDLATIVMRAMDKSPQRRFQSGGEMAEELQRFRAGLPIRSRRLHWPGRAWRLALRHRAVSVLALVAVLLIAVLVTVLQLQANDRQLRLATESEAARRALAAGDLPSAEQHLGRAAAVTDAPELASMRADVDCERRLQTLIVVLQGPEAHHDARGLARLAAELAACRSDLLQTARADAARAISSRLADANPLAHRALCTTTLAAWPRTAAALQAWSRGEDPVAAVQPMAASRDEPYDHLFAALAMRMSHRPETAIEHELRAASARGIAADAIRYSTAVALEAQGRYRAASDLLGQLAESPVYAVTAACDLARLEAHSGRPEAALRHLSEARAAVAPTPHFADLLVLSELDVLLEVGRGDEFWQRWHAAIPTHGHLATLWLRGGYAAAVEPARAEEAREHFERGLACQPDPARRAALDVALLQLDWMISPAVADLEPLPDDEVSSPERQRLRALAGRAEQLVASVPRSGVHAKVAAEALLVAAQAHRAIGDRAKGWALLERTCREHGDVAGLARFAYQVGYRVAQVLLSEPGFRDGDDESNGPLAAAAARGMLRGSLVLERSGKGGGERDIDDRIRREALVGTCLCALFLAEPSVALPAALALQGDEQVAPPVLELAERAIGAGGLDLAHLLAGDAARTDSRLVAAMTDARLAMEQQLGCRAMTAAAVQAALAKWRAQPRLVATVTRQEPQWLEFWRRVEEIERRVATTARPR